MAELITEMLVSEYETIIAKLGDAATDRQIISALVRDGDWSETGAREILQLARGYGTSLLRNALALAAAMRVEDGARGF